MLVPIQLCNHFKSQFCRVGTRYIWSNIAAFNQEAIEMWVDVYYHRTATLLKLTTEVIVVLLCKLKPFRCVIKSRIISIIIFPGRHVLMQTHPRMSYYTAELLLLTMVCFSYSSLMTVA